ncbi:formate dehydrogenase subunit delta [Xaviernesmea oryzae]|uniref:Formate dehydrogenase subunit delta n=1 Tax=Xaviernesmea oryzae TaxID=464029 RepID=A0A1X7CI35_9HYPH|nr:formate dehydrogenase subunit delta [Xaviernesmea oryzae]SME96740.1 formate dehydrogenase subunit delta [Xaviernesmea oryzae]
MSHDKSPEQLVLDKLVRMANQIATFFMSQPENVRAEGVATHINKFWEPRMRRQFFEHLDRGGAGLMPLVIEASVLIRRPEARAGSGVGFGEDAKGAPGGKGPGAGESLSEPSIPEGAA